MEGGEDECTLHSVKERYIERVGKRSLGRSFEGIREGMVMEKTKGREEAMCILGCGHATGIRGQDRGFCKAL